MGIITGCITNRGSNAPPSVPGSRSTSCAVLQGENNTGVMLSPWALITESSDERHGIAVHRRAGSKVEAELIMSGIAEPERTSSFITGSFIKQGLSLRGSVGGVARPGLDLRLVVWGRGVVRWHRVVSPGLAPCRFV